MVSVSSIIAIRFFTFSTEASNVYPSSRSSLMRSIFYALTPEKQAAFETMVKEIYPLQHIGTPEDIAKACVFLASDNASWITSTVLAVDGGLTTN